MEIISRGQIPTKLITTKCHNCDTVFRFNKRVEANYISDDRDGDYYSLRCPLCREPVKVDAAKTI